jgi:hypothetical protein
VIGSHAFRRLPKDLLCFFFSTRGIGSSTDPVYLGKGGQGWSEPAAMTPTDERASEREEIEFLAASESHFPPHTSFPTDRHLPFLHKFEHEKSLSWFPHNIQPQNPLEKNGRFT